MDIDSGNTGEGFQPIRRRAHGKRNSKKSTATPYGSTKNEEDDVQMDETVLTPVDKSEILSQKTVYLDEDGGEMHDDHENITPMEQTITKVSAPQRKNRYELRRLLVPQNRFTPLRKNWLEILQPLVVHMKLQVRMNTKKRCVEVRTSPKHPDNSIALQKGCDFIQAFLLGFEIRDALALLRLEDLFIESFEIKDVKRLTGDHLSRCIARLSGREGKTKYAIENSTRTRIVLADSKIHILGSYENIKLARHSICSLILGQSPGKVYNRLRTVTRRLAERL